MRRMPRLSGVTMVTLLTTLASTAWAQLTMNVTANRTQLYVGESVLLSVEVRGTDEIEPPDLSRVVGATIASRGSRSQNSVAYSMSSGSAPTVHRQFGRDFIYELTPTNVGSFVAGPVYVRAGKETLTAAGPSIYVMGVEAQDWVKVSVTASRDAVLVDEAFEIELSIGLRQLPAPYADHDPLNPQDPPRVEAPFLNVAPIDGLEGPNVQEMLQRLLVSRRDQPGFGINDFTVRADPFDSMFNMGAFMEQNAARFAFPRRTVPGPQGTYHTYTVKLKYVAKKEGDYTFGPVELKGQPIIDVAPGGQIVTRPVFAVGPAVVVRVVPPPEAGRPASFIGAVGSNLVVTASLDTQTCNVGDPLTLTLNVGGDISLDNLRPPVLSDQASLAQKFRIYDETVQVRARPGGKLYSYTVRPTQAGTYELPPIAVSYFDVRERAYRTVSTDPIPLRANESAQVGGSMILSASTNRISQRVSFSASSGERRVAPITLDPAGAEAIPLVSWPLHGPLALAGPAVLLLAGVAKSARHLLRQRAHASRPRGARRAALARLDEAAREPDARRRQARARAALALYVADRFKAPTTGLTPADVQRLLASPRGLPPDLVTRYIGLYEPLFLAEFAQARATENSGRAVIDDARELIEELDKRLADGERNGQANAPTPEVTP
ncbi:MAG: BatD family protein [Lentisphaerae bacterium]|nr:BatD family protein [Lentisphaerota bacterium]